MSTKACSKCGTVKPLSEFYKKTAASDGHASVCKICERAYCREYYQRNSEAAKLRARVWRLANPERSAENRRQWALNNRDKRDEITNKWVLEHPKLHEEHRKNWRSKNQEKVLCHQKLGYAVQKGWVLKSTTCQTCGITDTRIEGHHSDYSKPLEVMWLCAPCHKHLHVQQRRNE